MGSGSADKESDQLESAFETLKIRSTDEQQTSDAIAVLAAASKQNTTVREQLGVAEILQKLVEVFQWSLKTRNQASDHALRCIGNACSDNDLARNAITEIGFAWALKCLKTKDGLFPDLPFLTTQVLYNICLDFEPAQQQCYREKLHFPLLLFCCQSNGYDKSNLIDLLFLVVAHKATLEPELAEPLDLDILREISRLHVTLHADSKDTDTFATIAETILAYYRDATVQRQLIRYELVYEVVNLLSACNSRLAQTRRGQEEDMAVRKLLLGVGSSLVWILSDISATKDFATTHTLEHELLKMCISCIRTASGEPQTAGMPWSTDDGANAVLTTASCQVLGNVLWALKPRSFAYLVERERLQEPLLKLIAEADAMFSTTADLLHSAARVLVQLSRPSVYARALIGEEPLAEAAMLRLWRHEMRPIKEDCILLLRALGKDFPKNQRKFAELAREVAQSAAAGAAGESGSSVKVEEVPS